ncbi:hypothetical protein EVAR_30457_1 [Eumeta japonica]|uniref:Uncharacterized protein n=1 Tax=Eumeta variegata TaxID=151549 RepID=A0A4C1VY10_EUMVA|nr:hypothetical protein EVAR_30457_1 [Eumeta japonica]
MELVSRALDLLASYLTNRIQKINVDNMRSSGSVARIGVLQGSIFGPDSDTAHIRSPTLDSDFDTDPNSDFSSRLDSHFNPACSISTLASCSISIASDIDSPFACDVGYAIG